MAITHYYVRPVNGANVAGQGTSHATAYLTLQFAFDDIGGTHGRNAVDGDQVNLCDEGANVNAASLSLAIYGAPDWNRALSIRGYTAVANDGGIGEIDCNGSTLWAALYWCVNLTDLEIHSPGNNNCIITDIGCRIANCYVHQGSSSPVNKSCISISSFSTVDRCFIPAFGVNGTNIETSNDVNITNCYIVSSSIGIFAYHSNIRNNIIYCQGWATGIVSAINCSVNRNAIFAEVGSGGIGINLGEVAFSVTNNIIVNFSGIGGDGVDCAAHKVFEMGHNAFYNNTANYTGVSGVYYDLRANDVVLPADPFVNAAAGNFMLTAAAQALLQSAGWPSTYLGAAATDQQLTIGPVQYGEATVGGGRRPRIRWHGV